MEGVDGVNGDIYNLLLIVRIYHAGTIYFNYNENIGLTDGKCGYESKSCSYLESEYKYLNDKDNKILIVKDQVLV